MRNGQRANPLRRAFAFETLEPRLTLSVAPGLVSTPQTYSGALNGKIVFTSPGHGWQWNTTLNRYATDRGDNNEIVEDFGNQDQMTLYADYLLRAGATVVPMRPVGRQTNEVVLDNDSAGVTFTGNWSNSVSTKYYDEDYGAVADTVPYRYAGTVIGAETATATYTPNIPQDGFYPVYTWVLYGTDRTEQTYRINHTGGTTEIKVDHSKVGSGWVYLGTYHFDAGSSSTEGSVQIINKASVAGKVVIADAIRFGNGMGDYIWTASGATTVSGYPREDENSYHWIAREVGIGTSLATAIGSGATNVSAPSNMAQYMYHGSFGGALYMGIHSNAAGGRGARGLYTNSSSLRTPNQVNLAIMMANQINQDMQNLNGVFEYNWTTGTTNTDSHINFGEIDLGPSAEMDATIIEVAFHDDVMDAAIMRDPAGRDQIARSMYQGTLQYFATYGSPLVTNTSLPTPPTNVRAVSNASGAVTINWAAGANTPASVNGAAATGFRIYASIDGYGFDGGTFVAGGGATSATLTGYDPAKPYYFRVVAVNAGGESEPSEVVTALPSGGVKQVLVVNGFDRFDRTQDFRYPYLGGLVDRVWSRYNNSFDYVVQVQSAIQGSKPGVHVASTSNEAVISGAVNLSDYDTVVWILGTESTADHTFDATEQSKVTSFINAGGNLFLSGAEIAWDLDQQNNGRTFFETTLKGNYVNDDAGTYTATANAGGIFAGMSSFVFSNGSSFSQLDSQYYNVAYPDVINPQAGAVSALTYSGGTGGSAAIQVAGTGGKGSIVMFGFPFEVMTNASRRMDAVGRILGFFDVSAPAPAVDIKTRVNGQDADVAPGPTLVAGSTAAFTYIITNPGNVPLSSLIVKDNNGTPGNAADDFNATYTTGDTNSNGQLDVGETWTFTASRTVVAGQYTTTGTATAVGNAQSVMDTDPANYFGIIPENADFNGDGTVDAGDYVLWRNNNGLPSGATHSQGDANGDGAVNSTDYDIWRGQYGTSPGAGSGAGTAATGTVAAVPVANFPSAALAVSAPVATASNDNAALQVAFAKDAAFGRLRDHANEQHAAQLGRFTLREFRVNESHSHWVALLNVLANRKAELDLAERPAAETEKPLANDSASSHDQPSGDTLRQFSRSKLAPSDL